MAYEQELGRHEYGVEQFYSKGAKKRAFLSDGFLSFGYWTEPSFTYLDAAEALLDKITQTIALPAYSHILNVSCGFGAETIRLYHQFKPESIIGLDLTAAHIEHAIERQKKLNWDPAISFELGNACQLPFADEQFDLIIGIEGPAHYNTREDFFKEAYRVLKRGGKLLLSDIIVTERFLQNQGFLNLLAQLTAKLWHMPKENQITCAHYLEQLELLGFKIDHHELIGNDVFPGFAKSNTHWPEIKKNLYARGFFAGLGLTGISWLLGFLYKQGLSDYLIVSGIKE